MKLKKIIASVSALALMLGSASNAFACTALYVGSELQQEIFADFDAMKAAGYRQVLCANSFTSLAELSLHRAGKPALNYLVAEDRERVKGGEAACEALDVNSVFCYQPASSSCISMCFMLMYFFPPHWVPAT